MSPPQPYLKASLLPRFRKTLFQRLCLFRLLDTLAASSTTSTSTFTFTPSLQKLAFLLITTHPGTQRLDRQTLLFVHANRIAPNCTAGGSFVLFGNQLFEEGALISTNANTVYAPLLPGLSSDSTIGGFGVNSDGCLHWHNSAFTNCAATFCLESDRVVVAVFVQGSEPSDCAPITISVLPSASCPSFTPTYPSIIAGAQGTKYRDAREWLLSANGML